MSSHHLAIENLFSVKGWTCLVTGGGTGIGLMITQALAANGAKVYIAGRREEVIKKSAEVHGGEKVSGEIIPIVMDQNDKESIQAAFKEISSKEKHLNLLVNNAGLASKKIDVATGDKDVELFSKTMLDAPMSDWEDVYKTNVFGYYYVSAAFLPLLVKANKSDPMHKNSKDFSANIVNISSISGITKTTQGGQFAYNSSKAATIQLNRLLATEFSRENVCVRVNSIAPGYYPSEMTTSESDENNKSHMSQEGWRKEKMVPADRHGSDEDMAQGVLMLATNRYVNGQTLVIDGGLLIEMP